MDKLAEIPWVNLAFTQARVQSGPNEFKEFRA